MEADSKKGGAMEHPLCQGSCSAVFWEWSQEREEFDKGQADSWEKHRRGSATVQMRKWTQSGGLHSRGSTD